MNFDTLQPYNISIFPGLFHVGIAIIGPLNKALELLKRHVFAG